MKKLNEVKESTMMYVKENKYEIVEKAMLTSIKLAVWGACLTAAYTCGVGVGKGDIVWDK